jgi:hypothetical protein
VTFEGGMKYSESLKYIEYANLGITDLFETRVGKVNLCGTNGYIQWVNSQYGTGMTCQQQ